MKSTVIFENMIGRTLGFSSTAAGGGAVEIIRS